MERVTAGQYDCLTIHTHWTRVAKECLNALVNDSEAVDHLTTVPSELLGCHR